VCKVFPESWENYSIESKWHEKTNGGIFYESFLKITLGPCPDKNILTDD